MEDLKPDCSITVGSIRPDIDSNRSVGVVMDIDGEINGGAVMTMIMSLVALMAEHEKMTLQDVLMDGLEIANETSVLGKNVSRETPEDAQSFLNGN